MEPLGNGTLPRPSHSIHASSPPELGRRACSAPEDARRRAWCRRIPCPTRLRICGTRPRRRPLHEPQAATTLTLTASATRPSGSSALPSVRPRRPAPFAHCSGVARAEHPARTLDLLTRHRSTQERNRPARLQQYRACAMPIAHDEPHCQETGPRPLCAHVRPDPRELQPEALLCAGRRESLPPRRGRLPRRTGLELLTLSKTKMIGLSAFRRPPEDQPTARDSMLTRRPEGR